MAFLGWEANEIISSEVERIIESGPHHRLLQVRRKRLVLEITTLSRLSVAEQSLLNESFKQYPLQAGIKKIQTTASFLKEVALQDGRILTVNQAQKLSEILDRWLQGIGPFSYLMDIPHLEEIALSGLGEFAPIRVYHEQYGWIPTTIVVHDETAVHHWVNQLAKPLGRRITWQQPRLNAILIGGSRLHACFPPLSSQPSVTIRRFRSQPFSWADLIRTHFLDERMAAWLHVAMQCQFSILVVGNTGSGKTSLLNALMQGIPVSERMVCLEEVPELMVPHAHCVRLVSNPEMNVSLMDLVTDSLRMRPDRVVMGEIRSAEESKAFAETLFSGQGKGSLATFHGQSVKDALDRLREHGVSSAVFQAIDLIVCVRRQGVMVGEKWQEQRRAVEMCGHDGKGNFIPLMEWNPQTDDWGMKKCPAHLASKIQRVFGRDQTIESNLSKVTKWIRQGFCEHWSHHQYFIRQDDWRKDINDGEKETRVHAITSH